MKITTFNPAIFTKDAEAAIALFEELGFERRHTKTGIGDEDITNFRMRYTGDDGRIFHVDIIQADVDQDRQSIRMNVDGFDEARKLLEKKGFKNLQGDKVTLTPSSKSTIMVAPSGFPINLAEHFRRGTPH